jgi:hypothetical protein
MTLRGLVLGLSVPLTWLVGCGDPVRERAIEALGLEAPDVPPGPLHRAGQACVRCHDGEDSAVPAYSFAGTVYVNATSQLAAANVSVELLDAQGQSVTLTSNCVGNFYVEAERFRPVFPVWTAVGLGDYRIVMQSPIGRDGSCATCHAPSPTQRTTDLVYLYSLPDESLPESDCP